MQRDRHDSYASWARGVPAKLVGGIRSVRVVAPVARIDHCVRIKRGRAPKVVRR
jgi:hypothetical protein